MYIDNTHSQFLLKGLSLLRQDEELCDVELRVGDTKVFGHKVVLAAVSDYFKAMFTGRMEESIVRTVRLHDVDEKSVSLLVDFAYSGHISINNSNVESLLLSANMLRVSKVVTACSDFLIKQLHPSNCLGFFEFADKLALWSLKKICFCFATDNFTDLSNYDEFLHTGINTIKKLFISNKLNIAEEKAVFLALEKWILYDKVKRLEYFPKLFGYIRTIYLSSKFLLYLTTHQLVIESNGYLQLKINSILNSKKNSFRLLDQDIKTSQSVRRSGDHLVVIGGKDSYLNPLKSVSKLNVKTGNWKICSCLPEPRLCSAAAYNKGQLYLTGGIGMSNNSVHGMSGKHTSTVCRYSVNHDAWQSVASMNAKRSSHVTVSQGNKLYVIGGYDGKSSLKSAECYDPVKDCWTMISDMNYSRSSFAAVCVEDCIYALGGQSTCTVERYDTSSGKWELTPAMSTKRINFGAAEVCGFIYIVGGHDGKEYLRSMERFDPVSSEWTVVSPMPSSRSGIGVSVIRNQIYVLGGHDGSRYLNTAYKYDVFEDTWTLISNMLNARCYMAISHAYFNGDNDDDDDDIDAA